MENCIPYATLPIPPMLLTKIHEQARKILTFSCRDDGFVLPRFIFRVLSAFGGGMLGLGLLLFVGLTSCLHSDHEVRRRHEDSRRKQEKRRCSVNNIRN